MKKRPGWPIKKNIYSSSKTNLHNFSKLKGLTIRSEKDLIRQDKSNLHFKICRFRLGLPREYFPEIRIQNDFSQWRHLERPFDLLKMTKSFLATSTSSCIECLGKISATNHFYHNKVVIGRIKNTSSAVEVKLIKMIIHLLALFFTTIVDFTTLCCTNILLQRLLLPE